MGTAEKERLNIEQFNRDITFDSSSKSCLVFLTSLALSSLSLCSSSSRRWLCVDQSELSCRRRFTSSSSCTRASWDFWGRQHTSRYPFQQVLASWSLLTWNRWIFTCMCADWSEVSCCSVWFSCCSLSDSNTWSWIYQRFKSQHAINDKNTSGF